MMYISALGVSYLNFKIIFVYILLMYYCEIINIFIVLTLKKCENVKRFQTYILDLIKQTINNAAHSIAVKCFFGV